MIDHIKTTLTAAGCTLVAYESEQMSDIFTDQSNPNDIIGIVKEPDIVTFEVKGNGVTERFPPLYVEILRQCDPERPAEINRAMLESLRIVCRAFITGLIRSGKYTKITDVVATKITERKYDANVIGWSMALNIKEIENKLNC